MIITELPDQLIENSLKKNSVVGSGSAAGIEIRVDLGHFHAAVVLCTSPSLMNRLLE